MKTKLQIIFTLVLNLDDEDRKPEINEEDADEIFKKLDEREYKILAHRWMATPTRTLEETGQRFGVTRERIRQLQAIAFAKLRRAVWRMTKQRNTPPCSDENERVNALHVSDLRLSVRASNLLVFMNVETIGQLRTKTCAEMLKVRNCGKKSLREIHDALMHEYQIDSGWYNTQ